MAVPPSAWWESAWVQLAAFALFIVAFAGYPLVALVRDDMRKLRLYDPRRGTKLSSWIGMISTNTAYDFLRQTARRPALDRIDGVVEVDAGEESALDCLMAGERRAELNKLLSGYSDKDRTFVALYYAHGLEAEEVAGEMGISVKTVYSKKHKLLARLQRTLQPMMMAA